MVLSKNIIIDQNYERSIIMKRLFFLLSLATLFTILAACGNTANDNNSNNQESSNQENGEDNNEEVKVDLQNDDEESVGTATLTEEDEGVNILLEGENLPKGTHAFHIHEEGQCEAPDFDSAGDHFNPEDADHGFDTDDGPHAGDMSNISVGEDGNVKQSFLARNVTLEEDEDNSLLDDEGTSLIIHEGADDGKSQPAGDAGDKMACGVIEE